MAVAMRRGVGPMLATAVLLLATCGDGGATGTSSTDLDPPPSETPAPTVPPPTSSPVTPPPTTPPLTTQPATTQPQTTQPQTTPVTDPALDPSTTVPAGDVLVNVYWAGEVINPPVCCPERISAGGRLVRGPAVARGALEAMLDGPNAVEQGIGMLTTVPEGTRLLDLAVRDGVATVDLSGEFEEPSGSYAERFRVAQVVFTLTQFDNIDRVMFRIDGIDRDEIMSHGIPVDEGVTRNDDPDLRPLILLEHPHPGAVVDGELVIRGESNTFEANVRYVVTAGGGDGVIVTEGFTTATAGSGVWGTFETTVDLTAHEFPAGPGSVIVFESSARDGSMINVVEHPITLAPLDG